MRMGCAALVAEGHVLKAHIPPQGDRRLRMPQRPLSPQAQARPPARVHQRGTCALVHLRRLVHGLKDPLGAGQGGQEEVALLGELVDGQGRLAHKHQIAGKAAHVGQALHGHHAAQHGHDGVVDIGDAHHRRDHGGGIGSGRRCPPGAGPRSSSGSRAGSPPRG